MLLNAKSWSSELLPSSWSTLEEFAYATFMVLMDLSSNIARAFALLHVFFVFLTTARFKSMILTFCLVFVNLVFQTQIIPLTVLTKILIWVLLMKFKTWSYFGIAKQLQLWLLLHFPLWSQHKLN